VLAEIKVENVALIEQATLEFGPGLNAISGETGAGKTLLATALQMLLGGRARSEFVRAGTEKATIEGRFTFPEGFDAARLRAALGDLADEVDPEDDLVLRRTVTVEGRSRCYVNGVGVPVRALTALGENLVSYHSQREQVQLTDPAAQLEILDGFLEPEAARAREEHRRLWTTVERERRELDGILASSEARGREAEFLRYQLDELERASYSTEEVESLSRERDRLRNVTDLLQSTAAAAAALSSDEGGAVEAAAAAQSELERAAGYDATLAPPVERLEGVSAELQDILYELRAYLDELEADPSRLDEVENRLADLHELERKYGDVEEYVRDARERLERLEGSSERVDELEASVRRGEQRLRELRQTLAAGRRAAARKLAERVMENLNDLNLKGSFNARLLPVEPGPLGAERVEFEVSPNPGEPELPVRRYASGGELSRIMLAIRLAQRRVEPGASYIFDEVDAGIGGETATAVGEKLSELSERNQVLTITHLPQIASQARDHILVEKAETGGRTITRAHRLAGEERQRELARMLSGRVDEASLAHASELLVGEG
jgi:DNA repair protein RecN (Recombination protein N)